MVEAANYKHPSVDLEEFERRLRGPEPAQRGVSDPLAELARLVNGEGKQNPGEALDSMFARMPQRPASINQNGGSSVVKLPRATWDRVEPGFDGQPAANGAMQLQEELRGTLHAEDPQTVLEREMRDMHVRHDASRPTAQPEFTSEMFSAPAKGAAPAGAMPDGLHARPDMPGQAGGPADNYSHGQSALGQHAPEEEMVAPGPQFEAAPAVLRAKPKRAPVYVMGAIAAVGLTLIGGTFAWRANSASSPRTVAVIKAPEGPVKVAASSGDGLIVPNQDASVLDKAQGSGKPTGKVVSSDEQPIDLNLAPKAALVPQPAQPSVKAVAPPAANASTSGAAAENPFGPPKRVKTVAVRPDGSVIAAPAAPDANALIAAAPPVAAAAPPPRPAAANPVTAAPVTAPTTPPAKPKATVRVVSPAKPDAKTVNPAPAADDGAAPLQLGSAAGKAKPPAKVQVADATASVAAAQESSTGGKFSVQMAAPNNEQEAKDASNRFKKQFASALGGYSPSIHAGSNAGRTVYRVRVGNLSRDEATALCGNLKANGGNCFVAGN